MQYYEITGGPIGIVREKQVIIGIHFGWKDKSLVFLIDRFDKWLISILVQKDLLHPFVVESV